MINSVLQFEVLHCKNFPFLVRVLKITHHLNPKPHHPPCGFLELWGWGLGGWGNSEENVYMLCKRLCQLGLAMPDASDLFVVFISNSNCKVPLWRQKSKSSLEEGFCIWDYHVICIQVLFSHLALRQHMMPSNVWSF
jgi:hypothetical protein